MFLCLIVFNFINVIFVIKYFRICVLHFSNVMLNVVLHCAISYLIAFHIKYFIFDYDSYLNIILF